MHQKNKLGICVICGQRVFTNEKYLQAVEGYCHSNCLKQKTEVLPT